MHRFKESLPWQVAQVSLNNLVKTDPDQSSQIVSDLAKRWEVNSTGNVYTFFLRDDVKWSDGRPLSGRDVTYSFNRIQSDAEKFISPLRGLLLSVKSVELVDDYTVKFTLNTPSASFLLGLTDTYMKIMPGHIPFPDFNTRSVATGPFSVTEYKVTTEVRMVRNPTFFGSGPSKLPYLDGVRIVPILDAVLQTAAFRTGNADGSSRLSGIAAANEQNVKKDVPGAQRFQFVVSAQTLILKQAPPFDDPRVREAVHLILDRHELIDVALAGAGAVGGPNIPASAGGNWGIPASELATMPGYRQPKDPDYARVRELLAQYGLDKLKSQPVVLRGFQGFTTEATVLAAGQLKKFGFEITTSIGPFAAFLTDLINGSFQAGASGFGAEIDDPSVVLTPLYTGNGAQNYGKWVVPDVDRLMSEQDRSLDPTARQRLARDAEKAIINSYVQPTLFWTTGLQFWRPEVKGLSGFNAPLAYTNVGDWSAVWLDK